MIRFLRQVARGYGGIFRAAGFAAVLIGASVGCGFVVAWPLWLLATTQRVVYSLLALCALGGGVVYLVVRRLTRGRRLPSAEHRPRLRWLLTLAWIVVCAVGLYGVLLLVSRMLFVPAVVAMVCLVLILGYMAYAARVRPPRRARGSEVERN